MYWNLVEEKWWCLRNNTPVVDSVVQLCSTVTLGSHLNRHKYKERKRSCDCFWSPQIIPQPNITADAFRQLFFYDSVLSSFKISLFIAHMVPVWAMVTVWAMGWYHGSCKCASVVWVHTAGNREQQKCVAGCHGVGFLFSCRTVHTVFLVINLKCLR